VRTPTWQLSAGTVYILMVKCQHSTHLSAVCWYSLLSEHWVLAQFPSGTKWLSAYVAYLCGLITSTVFLLWEIFYIFIVVIAPRVCLCQCGGCCWIWRPASSLLCRTWALWWLHGNAGGTGPHGCLKFQRTCCSICKPAMVLKLCGILDLQLPFAFLANQNHLGIQYCICSLSGNSTPF